MLYADPIVNSTSMAGLFEVINTSTNNYFGFGLLVAVYIILFIAMKNFSFPQAFAASTFITTILAGMLLAAGLVTQSMVFVILALLAVSMFFLWYG